MHHKVFAFTQCECEQTLERLSSFFPQIDINGFSVILQLAVSVFTFFLIFFLGRLNNVKAAARVKQKKNPTKRKHVYEIITKQQLYMKLLLQHAIN